MIDGFVKDCRMLAARRDVRLQYDATGVWAYCLPGPGRPLLWRFPPPMHPLEAIAAIRGMGGLEPERLDTTRPEHLDMIRALAVLRGATWQKYTETISRVLFVAPDVLRRAYHAITPRDPAIRGTLLNALGAST